VAKHPEAYWRVTYPTFRTTTAGDLVAGWRIGGHTSARMQFTRYDGHDWDAPVFWNNRPGTGFYGSFGVFNGQLYACWSRRTAADQEAGYRNNRGLYLARCADATGRSDWFTAAGAKQGFPIADFEPFKIAEPSQPGQAISSTPSFVITPAGAFHARVTVAGQARHYYRLKSSDPLQVGTGMPDGALYSLGDRVYALGLEAGRPVIRSAPAGTNDWREEFKVTTGRTYSDGASILADGALYYYLMETGAGDARPLHVLRFDLPAAAKGN
jgi:hypothetical protein